MGSSEIVLVVVLLLAVFTAFKGIRAIPQVLSTRSTIVLETVKEDLALPLPPAS